MAAAHMIAFYFILFYLHESISSRSFFFFKKKAVLVRSGLSPTSQVPPEYRTASKSLHKTKAMHIKYK
jgi:hypothetical protein